MKRQASSAALIPSPRQLGIPFDPGPLEVISPVDRAAALARLTHLLLEAAGAGAEERDDDER